MGVRGLTTFIANRSSQYLERHELHDCYLVVDGNSIASQLYRWHCRCNDCFGGDYDKYANVINSFVELLFDCGITPLVIFDGAYEKRKLKTVFSRMKNKLSAARDINSVTEGSVPVFPLFLREVFVDILLKLRVKCVRCDFEGDGDAAFLAKNLNCPLLSYDSDFYIFDVVYIPFSNMDLRLRKKKDVNYIACEVYKVDKFLSSFGGLDKVNLPLLAVLLGNDYIKKSAFSLFYRQLKIQKSKDNEQQRMIKSVIMWLKNETPESALRKILGRYKLQRRKKLADKIQLAIEGYQCVNTQICSCFNVDLNSKQENRITVPKAEEIETVVDEDGGSEDPEQDSEEEVPVESSLVEFKTPNFFQENFRKCLYPSCFMDMIVSHTYYCIPQVENFSFDHSHTISLDILAAIHKILTFPETRNLICVARNQHLDIKKFSLPFYEGDVPKLSEIEHMDLVKRKKTLLDILNIEDDKIFISFPVSWHLLVISLKYWVTNSKNKVDMPHIYSAILCGIVLNYVDSRIGFYRSTKSFLAKYTTNIADSVRPHKSEKNILESVVKINTKDSISCLSKLIYYFQMDAKMKSNIRLFNRTIVHEFAQFQSCLLHIKHLNTLLNFPFPTFIISDFYDGTFLYNMTTNLMKRTDLKSYVQILLAGCPTVLNTFELMIEQIEVQIGANLAQREPLKKRRKKKKAKKVDLEENTTRESEEEYILDSNNIYSMLSFLNK